MRGWWRTSIFPETYRRTELVVCGMVGFLATAMTELSKVFLPQWFQAVPSYLWGFTGLVVAALVCLCVADAKRLKTLQAVPDSRDRPTIVFHQARGGQVYREHAIALYILEAWFKNVPRDPTEHSVAKGVTASIRFDQSNGPQFEVIGAWIASTGPMNISVDHSMSAIDIFPNDLPAKLGIAIKHRGGQGAYPFVQETSYTDFVHPDFVIMPGTHRVRVRLTGIGVREEFIFSLNNADGGELALTK